MSVSKQLPGVSAYLLDYRELIARQSTPPTFVNDIDVNELTDRKQLDEMLLTRFDSDYLSSEPTCECGASGAEAKGSICPECFTPVVVPAERKIESSLWIRAPEGVHALLHPQIVDHLSRYFKVGGVDLISWICDPYYKPSHESSAIEKLKAFGVKRGMNWFHDNHEQLFEFLFEGRFVNKSKRERTIFHNFWEKHKHLLFQPALPIPSKLAFIIESSDTGRYSDPNIASAIDAVRTITSLRTSITEPGLPSKESKAYRACRQLDQFYDRQFRVNFGPKKGQYRKHVFGSRPAHSFRAVITSVSGVHDRRHVELPYGLTVCILEEHIISCLLNRMGMNPLDAYKLFTESVLQFNQTIYDIIQTLIQEGTVRNELDKIVQALSIILQRNPSLKRLSAQKFIIGKIKQDPTDNTIGMSVLTLAGPNADFDGRMIAVVKPF